MKGGVEKKIVAFIFHIIGIAWLLVSQKGELFYNVYDKIGGFSRVPNGLNK